ncbi:MAG TPA: glycosyltransferase, partial [Dehalococcoidia bacterium]|nr:glycosyltransferase [Dehalococcoidia bacterium]
AGAAALLHPFAAGAGFDFGAVVALAAGAPVVGFRRGAMAEIVAHGETGFLVQEPWELAGAVDQIDLLSRRACRRRAHELFDAEGMVEQLESLYDGLLRGGPFLLGRATHPELEALDPRPLQPLSAA